jgi:hypothetical protein
VRSCILQRATWTFRKLRARQTSVLVPSDSVYLHQNHDQQNQWHEVCDCAANHSDPDIIIGNPFLPPLGRVTLFSKVSSPLDSCLMHSGMPRVLPAKLSL